MIDFSPLVQQLALVMPLKQWSRGIQQQFDDLFAISHGDLPRWMAAVNALPALVPTTIELKDSFALGMVCAAMLSANSCARPCKV